MNGADPMSPGATWARPRKGRKARHVDRLADAIDCEERARAKMRRALRAWEKAMATVDRLNKSLTKQVQS